MMEEPADDSVERSAISQNDSIGEYETRAPPGDQDAFTRASRRFTRRGGTATREGRPPEMKASGFVRLKKWREKTSSKSVPDDQDSKEGEAGESRRTRVAAHADTDAATERE